VTWKDRVMSEHEPLRVIVVGRDPEKMEPAVAVLESAGFAAIGVFSEAEAMTAIADRSALFAVVAGGFLDEAARGRLGAAAAARGAVLVTAAIGHDDPRKHFLDHVVPKLVEARDRR